MENPIISFNELKSIHEKLPFELLNASANNANPKYVEALRNAFNALGELKKFY